jgi:hypothetical protein
VEAQQGDGDDGGRQESGPQHQGRVGAGAHLGRGGDEHKAQEAGEDDHQQQSEFDAARRPGT